MFTNNFIQMKNTIIRILVYTLLFALIINGFKIFIQNPLFHDDYSNGYLIVMTILKVTLFLLTLFLLNYEKIKVSNYNKNKYLLIIVALIIFFRLYQNVNSTSTELKMDIDYSRLTYHGLLNLFIGLFEEFYFRVLVFTLLCSFYKKNLFKITVLTSLLFGIVHISSLLLSSYNYSDVLFQVMSAFAIGVIFQLLLINFKNIYIPVLIHFFIDFNSSFSEKFFNVTSNEIYDEGFDYTTFWTIFVLIILSLVFAYFNLRKKEVSYFQTGLIEKN